jgi:hypothetical protein
MDVRGYGEDVLTAEQVLAGLVNKMWDHITQLNKTASANEALVMQQASIIRSYRDACSKTIDIIEGNDHLTEPEITAMTKHLYEAKKEF